VNQPGFGQRRGPGQDPGRDLDRDVAGASAAHQRLLAGLDAVGERCVGEAAVAGAIIAALVEQADQHRVLLGTPTAPGTRPPAVAPDGRHDAIARLRRSVWALEMAWTATSHWDPARTETVFMRWRTVELAHLALSEHLDGLEYAFENLPGEYLRLELRRCEMLWRARRPMGLSVLAPAVLALEPALRLGWFLGCVEADGLRSDGVQIGIPEVIRANLPR
jgi:hypothetical protein